MADYSLVNNSPGAGYISWSNASMVYNGSVYALTNGSTNLRYAWWDLDDPTHLQTSDAWPTLTVDDAVVFVNRNGIGISVLDVDNLDGGAIAEGTVDFRQLAVGSIRADHIAVGAIQAGHVAAQSITAENMQINSITAEHITAGSITAEKVDVEDLFAQTITITGIKGCIKSEGYVAGSAGVFLGYHPTFGADYFEANNATMRGNFRLSGSGYFENSGGTIRITPDLPSGSVTDGMLFATWNMSSIPPESPPMGGSLYNIEFTSEDLNLGDVWGDGRIRIKNVFEHKTKSSKGAGYESNYYTSTAHLHLIDSVGDDALGIASKACFSANQYAQIGVSTEGTAYSSVVHMEIRDSGGSGTEQQVKFQKSSGYPVAGAGFYPGSNVMVYMGHPSYRWLGIYTKDIDASGSLVIGESAGGSTAGQVWNDSTQKTLTAYTGSLKRFVTGMSYVQTTTKTIASLTTSYQSLVSSGIGSLSGPAMKSGNVYRIRLCGHLNTAASYNFKVLFAGIDLTGACTVNSAAGASRFWLDATVVANGINNIWVGGNLGCSNEGTAGTKIAANYTAGNVGAGSLDIQVATISGTGSIACEIFTVEVMGL